MSNAGSGSPREEEGGTVRDFADVVAKRFSCRAFLPRSVSRDLIERVVDLAQRSPSWCNTQPWHLHMLSEPVVLSLKQELLKALDTRESEPDFAFPETYEGVYLERRRAAGWKLYESVGIRRGDRAASALQTRENFEFFGARNVAIVTVPNALGPYGAIDCGCFINGFCLAAEYFGLGSIAQAAIATYSPLVRAHLSIPEDRSVVCAISFGYPDPDHPANGFRTDRAPVGDVVTWL